MTTAGFRLQFNRSSFCEDGGTAGMQAPSESLSTATTQYRDTEISFSHPAGAKVIKFEHGEGKRTWRLIHDLDGQTRLRVNIEWHDRYPSARAAADAVHAEASELFKDEDVAPHAFEFEGHSGWRCRKRFVEGGTAPLIIDHAFIDVGPKVMQLTFAATPPAYAKGKWLFDLLLGTLALQDPGPSGGEIAETP